MTVAGKLLSSGLFASVNNHLSYLQKRACCIAAVSWNLLPRGKKELLSHWFTPSDMLKQVKLSMGAKTETNDYLSTSQRIPQDNNQHRETSAQIRDEINKSGGS